MPEPLFLTSERPLPYHAASADLLYRADWPTAYQAQSLIHGLAGFRIPTLPVAQETERIDPIKHLAQILHRFVIFIRALHLPQQHLSFALHVMAHPERSTFGAEVGIYLLCRAAANEYPQAVSRVEQLAQQVYNLFPTEGLFNYDTPIRLTQSDLRHVTFQSVYNGNIQVAELRKYEDYLAATGRDVLEGVDYIPHSFWCDMQLDPWFTLIETLANQTKPTAVTISLEPTSLFELEIVAQLAQQYQKIENEGKQRQELLDRAAQMPTDRIQSRSFLQTMSLARAYQAQQITDYMRLRAQRGAYVHGQLLAWQDQLFTMRTMLSTIEVLSPALVQAVRGALSSPPYGDLQGELGWIRPEIIRPANETERAYALQNIQWLGQTEWGESVAHAKLRRLRHVVTAKEAVGLFHLPVMPQAGQTSALSTASVPFVLPPEVTAVNRFTANEHLLNMGYMYQRERCLSPDLVGEERALPFWLKLADLEKPSLLVGAPGSGKSNLALSLLIQLWRDYKIPFLVIDPSTGHEYRYLLSDPSLREDLLVYTIGDEDGLPFTFNPFAVPPGVTTQSHITRILGCFKAAYEMWDPLPAIYEAALVRLYRQFGWEMMEKGNVNKPFPCLADFATAVIQELEENVLPDYGKGTEAGGILTGASKIRVNSILNNRWRILNTRHMSPDFFQGILKRPAIIELGALGDSESIALVMAFLITQMAGHIEYVYPERKKTDKPHLILIEEAHRLLSAESSSTSSANQGNTRGKSAEEMNTLLAEVRKFRQGVMVLDQRPSSLVGGVLDNALVNIMCRLNDRDGFLHLSNVLNLSPAQQKYVRTRLKPGDAVLLDSISGLPVLARATNVVDKLRMNALSPDTERQQMIANARHANLLPPVPEPPSVPATSDQISHHDLWEAVDAKITGTVVEAVKLGIETGEWGNGHQAIRAWIMQHRRELINPLLEQTILRRVITHFIKGEHDLLVVLERFQRE